MRTKISLVSLAILVGLTATGATLGWSKETVPDGDDSIHGSVSDSGGQPIRGAIVKATLGNKTVARYTDSSGRYRIVGLGPGQLEVSVDAFGFALQTQKASATIDKETNFKLTAHMDVTRLNSAQLRFLFPETKEELRVYARCSNCHGLELPLKRAGMPSSAWVAFLPLMTVHRWGSNQGFRPEWAATFGAGLDHVFGPDGFLGPKANPDFSKVKYTPPKDAALKATITEYTIPSPTTSPGAMPHSVRVDDNTGIVWLADYDLTSNNVVRFDPKSEHFDEFPIPLANALAHTGTVLADGRFIIALDKGALVKDIVPTKMAVADSAGKMETFDWADRPGGARVVERDPTNNDWVWVVAGSETWHVNVKTKEIRVYQNPIPAAFPEHSNGALMAEPGFTKPTSDGYDLAVDANGSPWVTQIDAATIFQIDPSTGKAKTFNSPEMRSARGIKIDASGNIWFADYYGSKLGTLNPKSGEFKFYQPPTLYASPYGITLDRRRGFVWYADTTGNHATRFDPRTAEFVEYPLPTQNSAVRFMGIDPKGRAWYGGFFSGKLGVVDPGDASDTLVSSR
jgi:streptogramin lyase